MIELFAIILGMQAGKATASYKPSPAERRADFLKFLEMIVGLMLGFALFVIFILVMR